LNEARGWSVSVAIIVLLITTVALIGGCGRGDPYSGTWLEPTAAPEAQAAMQVRISPANEGWWSVRMGTGPGKPVYVAKVGDELQSGNGAVRLTVEGDTLTFVEPAGYPTLTRQ
jgi:hypothetical protein